MSVNGDGVTCPILLSCLLTLITHEWKLEKHVWMGLLLPWSFLSKNLFTLGDIFYELFTLSQVGFIKITHYKPQRPWWVVETGT